MGGGVPQACVASGSSILDLQFVLEVVTLLRVARSDCPDSRVCILVHHVALMVLILCLIHVLSEFASLSSIGVLRPGSRLVDLSLGSPSRVDGLVAQIVVQSYGHTFDLVAIKFNCLLFLLVEVEVLLRGVLA